jgi:hypothetical protein
LRGASPPPCHAKFLKII